MHKKYIVRLTNEERERLRSVIKKLKGSSQKVRRAQVLLKADADVTAALSPEQIEEKFNLDYHFRQVDTIFERVFGKA